MHRSIATSATLVLLVLTAAVALAKRAGNRPYVMSMVEGAFYARGVPAGNDGTNGETQVYQVGAERDTLVDTYDFYAPHGVVLGWSPVAGKVALAASMNDSMATPDWRTREELRICLGGKLLKSYTGEQLIALGAEEVVSKPGGQHPSFRVVACEQVPGTNEYDFVVDLGQGRQVRLDILTGERRKK